MNSCVLLLSVGLFQIGGPLNTDAPSMPSFSTTSSLSAPAGKDEGKTLAQPTLRVTSDTGPSLSVADVFGPGPSVQVAEQPVANSGDNFGSLIAEEYGFVRL